MERTQVVRLGLVEYQEAKALQERLVEARKRRETPDLLLLRRALSPGPFASAERFRQAYAISSVGLSCLS